MTSIDGITPKMTRHPAHPDPSSPSPELARRDFVRTSVGALAAAILPGCSDSLTGPSGDPRLTARPGLPTVAPTLGLTDLGLETPRDGVLYVPTTYNPDVPAPLFVALHGAGGDADNWQSYPARAESRGMIFMAPDSRSLTWDLSAGGDFGNDVQFMDRALQYTFERCRIDPTRLALGGFSDGASYALSLGVSNGDLFGHLVAYSPGFLKPRDPIVGKPSVFVSHGTADPILPVGASRDVVVPKMRQDGYDVTYEEFAGTHEVPDDISTTALDWFLA